MRFVVAVEAAEDDDRTRTACTVEPMAACATNGRRCRDALADRCRAVRVRNRRWPGHASAVLDEVTLTYCIVEMHNDRSAKKPAPKWFS
jgi:hypothetical protein